jgi:hypothetical protein
MRCCAATGWRRDSARIYDQLTPDLRNELMPCYAATLGDCAGALTREHYLSASIQRLMLDTRVEGMRWQAGTSKWMAPETYAVGRMLCQKHHDELHGLDDVGLAFCRNILICTRKGGDVSEIATEIDGRQLERWLLKVICGAIGSQNIGDHRDAKEVSPDWVRALFARSPWPETYALHFFPAAKPRPTEQFSMQFHWTDRRELAAFFASVFGLTFSLALFPLLNESGTALRRPKGIGIGYSGACGGNHISGRDAFAPIEFRLKWPQCDLA